MWTWTLLCFCWIATASPASAQHTDTLRGSPWLESVFTDAQALRRDASGRLYVADRGASALLVFERDGTLRSRISGSDHVQLLEPVDVEPTNGLLVFVADAGGGQIVPIGEDGLFLEPLGGLTASRIGQFGEAPDTQGILPVAVATTARGDVLAVDAGQQQLLRWDASRRRTVVSGPAEGVLVAPRALAVWDARLYVLDREGVVIFDALGTFLRRAGQGIATAAVRLRRVGDHLVLVLPDRLVFLNREGGWEQTSLWDGPPLRDVVLVSEALLLLTARAIYRVPR